MRAMFEGTTTFNQDLSTWDVSSVTYMSFMFENSSVFNQDISNWDVSNVAWINALFSGASAFNQDISSWDVSNITLLNSMFYEASNFNQDLSRWDVSNVTDMRFMFEGVTLSPLNYDALLLSWSNLSVQNGVHFSGGNSKYSDISKSAREHLIDFYSWTITDGGPDN